MHVFIDVYVSLIVNYDQKQTQNAGTRHGRSPLPSTPNKAVAPRDVQGILAYITQSIQQPAIIQSTRNPRAPGPYFGPLPLELPWRLLAEEHGGVCRGEVRVLEQTAFAKTLAPQSIKVLRRNARASWSRRLRRERAGLGGLARTDTQGTRYT